MLIPWHEFSIEDHSGTMKLTKEDLDRIRANAGANNNIFKMLSPAELASEKANGNFVIMMTDGC